jgi:hypothetical protein
MTPYEKFSIAGSLSSMFGLLVSLYVLLRELVLQRDVTLLKEEEEAWHRNEPRK